MRRVPSSHILRTGHMLVTTIQCVEGGWYIIKNKVSPDKFEAINRPPPRTANLTCYKNVSPSNCRQTAVLKCARATTSFPNTLMLGRSELGVVADDAIQVQEYTLMGVEDSGKKWFLVFAKRVLLLITKHNSGEGWWFVQCTLSYVFVCDWGPIRFSIEEVCVWRPLAGAPCVIYGCW